MCKAATMSNKPPRSVAAGLVIPFFLAGCSGNPVIRTRVIDRPVPVPCLITIPAECKSAYAVDRVSAKDDPLTINRAMRVEIEERSACEVKLLAAVKSCNGRSSSENASY